MSKRKLNSGPAQSRKRTKLDGPQDGPRTRRAGRSSPSPPPRASSSLATADAGQGQRSKRKRTDGPNDDSNKDSSKEPATKRARTSQSPGGPSSAEAGPSTSQDRSTKKRTPLRKLSPRTRASRSVPVGRRAEQEEEAADGEESGSESIWPGLGSPDPNYVPQERVRIARTFRYHAEDSPTPEPAAMPASVDAGAGLLFENSSVPVGTRDEQEEEAADGEESGSESITSGEIWPGVRLAGPDYVEQDCPSLTEAFRFNAEDSPTPEPEPFPRDSTEAHRPRGALESPPRSPPPALQQEQSAAMPALVDVGARLLFENSLVAVGTRPEQEEEASDGEESGSESISSERRRIWPGVMETARALAEVSSTSSLLPQTASRQSTPSTVRQSPPLQRQPPKKKAKKVKKVKKAKKAKKAKEAGMTQDRKRPPPAAIEDLLRSRRSTRRDKGCTLWCLGDNGAACPVASSR